MVKRKLFILLLLGCCSLAASAQYTYGTTGLIHVPSAEMQRDKTLMIGGNFMNKELTPSAWYYHTYNYYLNITFFPWLEIAYTCTLFNAESLGLAKYGYSPHSFTNQDRYFSFRLRAVEEGQFWKYMPAILLGCSDPFSFSSQEWNSKTGNGYFCRFYLAATKHIPIGSEEVGVHLSYLYNEREQYKLNGVAAGISYNPSFHPQLRLIAEYDTKDFAMGATYLLFKHIHFQAELQRMKYFSGGLTFLIHLK